LRRLAEIVMPGTVLSTIDVESDQYLALEWIAYDDPRTELISNLQELQERFSLVVLFHSTTKRNSWINNARWLSGEHHCDWEMIRYDQENKVVEVALIENGLNGILATELGNLGRLQSGMFTADANLRGTIPSELGRTALTSLQLSANDLGGNLPSELGDLENLQFLDVSNNYLIEGIPSEI
jgi:Leucine-rich repeat (LRR) protein